LFDRIRVQIFVHTMIGTKLAHYEITSHIGSVGMRDVYRHEIAGQNNYPGDYLGFALP
jgi:hypothetical protein